MASQSPPGSTGGEPRTTPARSAPAAPRVTQSQRCILLGDWWLERVEGREGKIRVAGDAPQTSQRNSVARRVFRSSAIAKRHDDRAIETEDGYRILIGRLLNTAKTRENGFSEEVCEWFLFGFPIQWLELVNPNMEQQNEQAQSQSESTANAPRHSVEYYMEMLSTDSFTKSMNVYAFMESDFFSSAGYTSNKDGPDIQSLLNLTDGIAGNMAASSELYGGRANMPEKPLTAPGETCCSGQENDQHESRTSMPEKPLTAPGETCSGQENGQHESTQIDAREQGIVNLSIGSISVNQSTSSICPNSKEHSILAPSKTESVEKEGYRSRVGCCQAEEDADIHQHENMQSYSTEQEMVAPPIDAAIVNDNLNSTAAALEEPGTPQFGAVRGSDDTTVRRLRSGKVFGTPSGGPMKRRYKKRKMQQSSNKNMVPNEGGTSTTANLTSHGNDSSAAGIVGKDKQESHDPHRKRQGKPAKKAKTAKITVKENRKLFWNWL